MKYFRKPISIEAYMIPANAREGDYLVIKKNECCEVISAEDFAREFSRSPSALVPVPKPDLEPEEEILTPPPRKFPRMPLKPTEADIALLKKQEAQTAVMCCATCGADVQVKDADANKDCPKCSTLPKGTRKQVLIPCPSCGDLKQPHKIVAGKCVDCLGGD